MSKKFITLIATLAMVSACASDNDNGRTVGETLEVGGLSASSWAMMDDNGVVTEVGFSIDREVAQTLDVQVVIPLALPEAVKEQTLFDHIQIDFMNEGHGPGPFLVPHFDFHFYTVTAETLTGIDCEDEPMPEAERMPEPYIIPDTALDPEGTCVPVMGVHAINPTSPELAPESTTPFTEHFILGYHNGEMTFIEPMIAQSFLAEGNEVTADVPRPAVFGQATRYPGTWSLKVSEDGTEYEVVFSNFTDIE